MAKPYFRIGPTWDPERATYGSLLAYEGQAHITLLGATGSNKTTGLIIPAILAREADKQSIIVISDVNGTVAAVTARHRRRVCGEENVKIINTSGLLTEGRPDLVSRRWNPILFHPDQPDFIRRCILISQAGVPIEKGEHQKFFPRSARRMQAGVIAAHVTLARRKGETPDLAQVRALASQGPRDLKASIKEWMKLKNYAVTTLLQKYDGDSDSLEDVKSTLEEANAFLVNEDMRRDVTGTKPIDFGDASKRPQTYYNILKLDEVEDNANHFRMLLQTVLSDLYRAGRGPIRTTIIIEEGYVLGHMAALLQAVSVMRNVGVTIVIVFQSIGQMRELYGESVGLFMSGPVIALRPGGTDLDTAKFVSEACGEETVPVLSASDPNSPTDLWPRPSWGPQKRPRIPVDKVLSLPDDHALALLPGRTKPQPVLCEGYFDIPEMNARADPNPWYLPDQPEKPINRFAKRSTAGPGIMKKYLAAIRSGIEQGRAELGPPSPWVGRPRPQRAPGNPPGNVPAPAPEQAGDDLTQLVADLAADVKELRAEKERRAEVEAADKQRILELTERLRAYEEKSGAAEKEEGEDDNNEGAAARDNRVLRAELASLRSDLDVALGACEELREERDALEAEGRKRPSRGRSREAAR